MAGPSSRGASDSGCRRSTSDSSHQLGLRCTRQKFLLTTLRLAAERNELKIVNDQIGAPTWSRMIAESTSQILVQLSDRFTSHAMPLTDISGIYHLTAGGKRHGTASRKQCSNFPPVSALTRHTPNRPVPKLIPIPTSGYPLPARRPAYSVMSSDKLRRVFGLAMQGWEGDLRLCMENFMS